ncbi:MAG: acetate kinase [Candidatus Omnitrophota bacterium]
MKILVVNSGSSSIKYQLFDTKTSASLCKGLIERIGTPQGPADHYHAMKQIFQIITDPESGAIGSYSEIAAIGHRVVHGAEVFTQPTIINTKVLNAIKKFSKLAPLHNPPAILGIDACRKFLKHIPQVAVFDTAFHQTMPAEAYMYGIQYKFYKKYGMRRYGFHGTSHLYVAQEAAKALKEKIKSLKIITCHLGNGCSITAVKNGKSIDTSMGFTPLEGIMMGTRSGDIDPAAVLYLMEKEHLNIQQTNDLLNKKSGLLGLSGISNDMRDIIKEASLGNKRAKLAIDVFIYRIIKYIGAYAAVMDGVDAIVLTAGIGENFISIHKMLAKSLKNILKRFSAKILVIHTNEELIIAQQTAALLKKI